MKESFFWYTVILLGFFAIRLGALSALLLLSQTSLHAYESKEACKSKLTNKQSDVELIKMICDSASYPAPKTEKEKEWEKERERLQEEALTKGVVTHINIDDSFLSAEEETEITGGGNQLFNEHDKAEWEKERLRTFCMPYEEARRRELNNYYNTAPINRKYLPSPYMAWAGHPDCDYF